MVCIYKATCKSTGKVYIGKTNNLKRRIIEHRNHAEKDGGNFHKDILQYGFGDFTFEVVEECDDAIGDDREAFYIKQFRDQYGRENIYNICNGGPGGYTHDISGSNNPMYGKHLPEETRKQISNKLSGKRKPPGFGERVSAALRGKKKSAEAVAKKSKPITVYNQNTGEVRQYCSRAEMERCLHCNTITITSGRSTKDGWRLYTKAN